MTKRAEIEVIEAASDYFHNSTPGLGPDVELYQNVEWGQRQREKTISGMFYFESILRKQPFVARHLPWRIKLSSVACIFAELVKLNLPPGKLYTPKQDVKQEDDHVRSEKANQEDCCQA